MPSACGIACEVCNLRDKGICLCGDGCLSGTDPAAPEKLERYMEKMGRTCRILECAIENGVDHCFRCASFPC